MQYCLNYSGARFLLASHAGNFRGARISSLPTKKRLRGRPGFCPLKIKITHDNFLMDSVLMSFVFFINKFFNIV